MRRLAGVEGRRQLEPPTSVEYRCAGDHWRSAPVDAIEDELGATLSIRIWRGAEVDRFDADAALLLKPIAETGLRRALTALDVEWIESPEPRALLRGAIDARQAALAADERGRQARWIVDEANRLSAGIESDRVALRALEATRRARREASRCRAVASAYEGRLALARRNVTPALERIGVVNALRSLSWSHAWTALIEPRPSDDGVIRDDAQLALERSRHELNVQIGEALAWLLIDAEEESKEEAEEPAPKRPRRISAGLLDFAREGAAKRDEPKADLDGPALEDGPLLTDGDAVDRMRLEGTLLAFRGLSLTRSAPSYYRSNAWCAMCGSEFSLPPSTDILDTRCGGCAHALIPHPRDWRPLPIEPPREGLCPGCGSPVHQHVTATHVRCNTCASAVLPFFE